MADHNDCGVDSGIAVYATQVLRPPSSFEPPAGVRAGWYPDPYGNVYARYFDGRQWTPHTTFDPRASFVSQPDEEHPVLPFAVVVGAVVILFASLLAQNRLIDHLVERRWNVFVYMAISVVVGYGPSVTWMWFISRRWGTGRVLADLGVRFRWVDLAWGPLIWISTIIAVAVTVGILNAFDVPYRGNLEARSIFAPERTEVISLAIAAVVFAPIVEEAIFRGAVMRGLLSKMNAPLAIGLQGMLFGAAHFQPSYGREGIGLVITLGVAGVGFGLGCYLLRRIGPSIIAHAVFNSVAIAVAITRWY